MAGEERPLRVVLFSGGRGSEALSRELVSTPRVELTLAVNGYDDGLSTGEVRRALGDCLGPSDFRKNATRLASALGSAQRELVELFEARLSPTLGRDEGRSIVEALRDGAGDAPDGGPLLSLLATIEPWKRDRVREALGSFLEELDHKNHPFEFSDCSIGNLIFGGLFIVSGRRFNQALDAFLDLLGLPTGMVENVGDGGNAYLVAVTDHGRVLASEAEIVDSSRKNLLRDIRLLGTRLSQHAADELSAAGEVRRDEVLRSLEQPTRPNQRLLEKIREADVILYAPGTQHSSLFPSYMVPGVGRAIAENLRATKLFLTNLREDADIPGASATSIIDRAVHYLRERGKLSIPVPCLITHYLINDPGAAEPARQYVPLGSLDDFEDPRLVRIGHYEEAVGGRHDAAKVLRPVIAGLLAGRTRRRAAVWLHGTRSLNKIGATLIEMVRGGVESLPCDVDIYYDAAADLDPDFRRTLPFRTVNLASGAPDGRARVSAAAGALRRVLSGDAEVAPEFVVLFDSSGMYKGSDIVALLDYLKGGRVDAVWGSRRLSVSDVNAAYRLVHRGTPVRAAISRVGSHVLSLGCLVLYGRYISDTLSGVRAIRADFLDEAARTSAAEESSSGLNFRILCTLLKARADVFEMPVRFFPISPERVHRTTLSEGLSALGTMLRYRFKRIAEPEARNRDSLRRPFFGDVRAPDDVASRSK